MDPQGRIVAVTGGGAGIGRALCEVLAQAGAQVAVMDLSADAAKAVAEPIDGLALGVDVTDEAALQAAVEKVEQQRGPIDCFVSNAGVAFTDSEDPAEDALRWQRTLEVNLMAHVSAARIVLPGMLSRGEGQLVNVASAAGLLTQVGAAAYSASKHAAVGFAESLAITYGHRGIEVSVVCPQYVSTNMIDGLDRNLIDAVPGQVLTPTEAAQRIAAGMRANQFMILTHPEVAGYFKNKADDYERWIAGMAKLRARATADGNESPE